MKKSFFTLIFTASLYFFSLSQNLVITGVYDTQPAGAGVKGIELKALTDIADLSIYGIGSANNGGGTDGKEATFPAIAVTAGTCLYMADDSTKFFQFFGFYPNFVAGGAMAINGDDAIELFQNDIVIDVFGDIVWASGATLPWNYMDGWAYRKNEVGPNGGTFNADNWTYSGINALDNIANNASAPNPFPTCSFTATPPTNAVANDDNVTTEANTAITINVLGNDVRPNPLTSLTVTQQPGHGSATANGLEDIDYTPDPGYCGPDQFTYQICDANGCDDAIVSITISCYPVYSIATVTTINPATGRPDSLGVTTQIEGVVHGIDLQGTNSIQFYLMDLTGGISLFSSNNFGYTVKEGDRVAVRGEIVDFNCLTQIDPDTLWKAADNQPLRTPLVVTSMDESHESELIRINNLTIVNPSEWTGTGSGFNVAVTNGTTTFSMRIDNDVDLYSLPAPSGSFDLIGIGSQFDNDGTCDGGYQILPRYKEDIIQATNTKESQLAQQIRFFPNPANDVLHIESRVKLDEVSVSNLLGQRLLNSNIPGNFLDINCLRPGLYLISFTANQVTWTARFTKG